MENIFNQNKQSFTNVIELFIDDVDFNEYKVSVVDEPAIQKNFLKFNKDNTYSKPMFFSDDEKRIIVGPVLVPDMKIFRLDDEMNEYYVYFSESTIENIAHKFVKEKKMFSFNLDHKYDTNKIYMIESWLSRTENELNLGLPKGTWFIACKVDDDNLWKSIKEGVFNGFSLEGTFEFNTEDKYDIVSEVENWIKNN